jgi:plastocyanin
MIYAFLTSQFMQSEQQFSLPSEPQGVPPSADSVTIELTAENKAFDLKSITVPAGAKVTINFHNKDTFLPHNFALNTDSTAQRSIFIGDIILVKKHITYEFTAPSQPGTYFFRCDVHPKMMYGDFIVE